MKLSTDSCFEGAPGGTQHAARVVILTVASLLRGHPDGVPLDIDGRVYGCVTREVMLCPSSPKEDMGEMECRAVGCVDVSDAWIAWDAVSSQRVGVLISSA